MGIINLEDMINPTIKEKLDAYRETAPPERVVEEMEALGVEFEPITMERGLIDTDISISDEFAAILNDSLESVYNPDISKIIETIDNQLSTNPENNIVNPESNVSGILSYVSEGLPDYLINDPEIVGYPNLEFQEQIYNWVKGSLPTWGYTIKDLGCGRGDFFGHISKRESWEEKFKDIHYFGIELNPNLCAVAKQKYPEINVLNNDYFDTDYQTDYTVCIGTLGDNLGQDKWENFNKTLNWAINNTKIAVIFILQKDCYGNEAFFDYPFGELFENLDPNLKFNLDYSEIEDIYKLTVHIDGFNY